MRQRGAAWCASRVTLDLSISNSLWAVPRADTSRAGAFSCFVTRIVPDNSEITALICYIDVVLIDGCSIVSSRATKEAQEDEQEAGQRRGIDNEAQGRALGSALYDPHFGGTEAKNLVRQDAPRGSGQAGAR